MPGGMYALVPGAALLPGVLKGAGDTVAGWQDVFNSGLATNYFTGESVSGTVAFEARFMSAVTLTEIALTWGGSTAARTALKEDGEAAGSAGERSALRSVDDFTSSNVATDAIDGRVSTLEPSNPNSISLKRNGDRLTIDQGSTPTCGPTSCAMVLDTAGRPVNLKQLIVQADVRANGTTMPKLAEALNANGLESRRVLNVTIDDLANATMNGDPAIVRMSLDRGGHAVVVDGVTVRNGQKMVAIRDPALGRQYFTPVDEFMKKFSGEAIFTKNKMNKFSKEIFDMKFDEVVKIFGEEISINSVLVIEGGRCYLTTTTENYQNNPKIEVFCPGLEEKLDSLVGGWIGGASYCDEAIVVGKLFKSTVRSNFASIYEVKEISLLRDGSAHLVKF
ncbi:hypothetical protein XsacCFBP4641_05955 [Xanthomonas sacchari]|uniref:Peptidase C39 domain-containing protein n=2 Tax=Xanthomonas sacchari TaxID=56458 RepID=A0A2P5Z714_9XANT|nr:hypothetical protein XsacCFBP4641_05955 [Xanthomonas sacchari]